jgi:hypothetical protein
MDCDIDTREDDGPVDATHSSMMLSSLAWRRFSPVYTVTVTVHARPHG